MTNIGMAQIKLTDAEIQAATDVLRSGALRQGKQCEAFEQEFAGKTGARHAVTSASGSAALHLAYMAFLQPGDEVLVPAFTFIATGSMVSMSGGKPVFCDADPDTFLMDLNDAAQKVSEKTRAIAPVHLYGNPCDMDAVNEFSRKYNLVVVWDAAQAHGATYNGRDVGAFGDFVCYSFYPSKNMFVGEGGMTCTDNQDFENKMRFMRTHGQTGKYYHTMLGFNYRMTDVEAAIGREQLKRLDDMLAIRRRNARILNNGLKGIDGIKLQQVTARGKHAWHQYCVTVDPDAFGMDRDALAAGLKAAGIASGVHYPRGLHRQPIFEELYGKVELPRTDALAATILALPVHHGLSEEDARRIVEAIRKLGSGA
ncbi:MAG: aminotransferase DegT [Proteobacteria bacterium]|nr:MAG: aminotransferase DegT [Pseudomonadota bacterium]